MTVNQDAGSGSGMSRKRFLDWLLGGSVGGLLAAVVYPVTRYIIPPKLAEATVSTVVLPFEAGDMAANSGRIFKFGSKPAMIVKTATGELRAFSAECTHLDCTVQYRDDLHEIWCACHNGHYDLQGKNIEGPPPRPLDTYKVDVAGDDIYVTKGA